MFGQGGYPDMVVAGPVGWECDSEAMDARVVRSLV